MSLGKSELMYNMDIHCASRKESSEINVIGAGTEFAVPDIALIAIDLFTKGEEPLETEVFNSKSGDQVLQWLKQFGIQDKDINIQKGILTPLFNEEGEIINYHASTFINLTFYELVTLSEFYHNIRGVDIKINQIILMLQDLDKYYYRALRKAVISAYKKAKEIADTMNTKLVPIPIVLTEISNIENILNQIIINETTAIEDIKLNTIVIPATVEVKFLVESF